MGADHHRWEMPPGQGAHVSGHRRALGPLDRASLADFHL